MLNTTPATGMSSIVVPPCGAYAPVSDENVCGSRNTCITSAWRLITQKPSPSGV